MPARTPELPASSDISLPLPLPLKNDNHPSSAAPSTNSAQAFTTEGSV